MNNTFFKIVCYLLVGDNPFLAAVVKKKDWIIIIAKTTTNSVVPKQRWPLREWHRIMTESLHLRTSSFPRRLLGKRLHQIAIVSQLPVVPGGVKSQLPRAGFSWIMHAIIGFTPFLLQPLILSSWDNFAISNLYMNSRARPWDRAPSIDIGKP